MTTEIKGGLLAQGSDSEIVLTLRAARATIERGWCRFTEAIDKAGHDRAPDAPDAVKWCSNGVLWLAAPGEERDAYNRRRDARWFVLQAVGWPTLTEWNDTVAADKAEVLAAFDRAIALAEGNAPQAPPGPAAAAPQETP